MSMFDNNILPFDDWKSNIQCDDISLSSSELSSATVLSPNSNVGIDQAVGNRQLSSFRAERTPGMAAVSGYADGAGTLYGTPALTPSKPSTLDPGPRDPLAFQGMFISAPAENAGSGPAPAPAAVRHPEQQIFSPLTPYLDLVDKVSIEAKTDEICQLSLPWLSATCDKGKGYFIWAEHPDEDPCKRRDAKELVCGKEWCKNCGEDKSIAHNRRFLRWLRKIRQFKTMGYFVFTVPESIRDQCRNQRVLGDLGHGVQEILKDHGFSKGLRRFHWFGDKSTKYHPHLNVLVEGQFLAADDLEAIKKEYAQFLGVEMAVVNYEYRKTPGEMIHTLRYVTRATFKDYEWDVNMAVEIHKFRNMVVWGRPDRVDKNTGEIQVHEWRDRGGILEEQNATWSMKDLPAEEKTELEGIDIEAIEALGAGLCPDCHRPRIWHKPLPSILLKEVVKTSLGAGYYHLEDKTARAGPPGASKLMKVPYQEIKKARGDPERSRIRVETHRRRAAWIQDCINRGWR